MHIRTDSVLHSLLRELHERAHADVAPHLYDALDMMGARSPYKGGRKLLAQLEFAEREAVAAGDSATVDGLRDAIGYADGRIVNQDLEDKHGLYNNSGNEAFRLLSQVTSAASLMMAKEIQGFLDANPDATAHDVVSYYENAGERAVRFARSRRAGHYGAFRIGSDHSAWMVDVLVDRAQWSTDDPVDPRIRSILDQDDAHTLVWAAEAALRERQLDAFQRVVMSSLASEDGIRRRLAEAAWMFGGAYVEASGVRQLALGSQVDIALVRPDGVLHVVELKLPSARVVKRHNRTGVIPTADVHDAVAQVAGYLRDFDEQRAQVLARHGLDVRRASATVVIGHPAKDPAFGEQEINEALRTYTSHLSRIDVLTYKQLIDGARRSLQVRET